MKINKINVKEIAQSRIDCEKHDIKLYKTLYQLLKKFEGKKLTKRHFDSLTLDLMMLGYTKVIVFPEKNNNCAEVTFIDPTHPSEYRRENCVSFSLPKIFSLKEFEELNSWASRGAPERIKKSLEAIENGTVEKLQKAYDLLFEAQEILKDISSYDVPLLYDIEEKFGFSLKKNGRN
jgi:hypothetical protein